MAKIKIDKEKCIGCGLCSSLCPDSFEMEGDKAKLKKSAGKNTNDEKEAEKACPTEAIKIV